MGASFSSISSSAEAQSNNSTGLTSNDSTTSTSANLSSTTTAPSSSSVSLVPSSSSIPGRSKATFADSPPPASASLMPSSRVSTTAVSAVRAVSSPSKPSSSGPATVNSSPHSTQSLGTANVSSVKSTSPSSVHSNAEPKTSASTATRNTENTAHAATLGSPSVSFTATSTITDTPESTLAKASFVSVIESNGQTSSSAPPFLTVLSTSTEPNGSLVTYTHVVANGPTGISAAIVQPSGFFHNSGVVAGVFLVVGAILTGLAVFGLYLLCRRQRRRRELHRRWLVSKHRPRPLSDGDPFSDMRSFDRPWDGRVSSPRGHYSVAPPRRVEPPVLYETFDDEIDRRVQPGPSDNDIGLAITTDSRKPAASANSSPSIYPSSLPPVEEEVVVPMRQIPSPPPPPRPRRSILREQSNKVPVQLITPPSSVSSHSPISDAVNPFRAFTETPAVQKTGVQLNEIFARRTLLDVRPLSQASMEEPRQ
ncbi:hypothetical protein HMN09_00631500 [Mycena chlorophos]|uniref:Uncharacterized protein n=1 Tax=Mycena chlorophos TaxID=658473 RepID=A0A8H6T4I3_MYCCL|nr:hypothetical protein HMN09_00631500 [Mycena chlorophos]